MTDKEFADKAINLYNEYRSSFGVDLVDDIDRVDEYDDKITDLICQYKGHVFFKHKPNDAICLRCERIASKLSERKQV